MDDRCAKQNPTFKNDVDDDYEIGTHQPNVETNF
jgi:hypothetical protein